MKILDLVKNCARIGISGHENPDGDCVGSCCGLALFLRKALPSAQVDVFLESFPEALMRNIPGAESILFSIPADAKKYDAFIVLDSMPDRIGEAARLYEEAALKINIDHHKTNPGCGDAFYVDEDASSACELVLEVIDDSLVNRDNAQALYVGIVTDTGVFQYSNTKESTMRTAGRLMSYGFDHTAVIREVFFERTFLQGRMLGLSLVRSELLMDGKCIFCVLDGETIAEYGASRKDLDRISSQLLLTEGVDCAVFLHETDPGIWRGSFRSSNIVDVARTASLFKGGGHTRAAGCTIRSEIGEAVKILKEDIKAQLLAAGIE